MKRIVIFGAGNTAKKLLEIKLRKDVEIVKVVANHKVGQIVNEYVIESPKVLKYEKFDKVIVATKSMDWTKEIYFDLVNMGVADRKIYFFSGFESLYTCDHPLDQYFEIEKDFSGIVPFTENNINVDKIVITETSKSHERRVKEGFYDNYCKGKGIDIGYGNDPLKGCLSGWDLINGDAQYLRGIKDETFDYVYSSHCLEHVNDVRVALKNWFRIVKTNGYLIIAVPDRDLYEKKRELPSMWNWDHKHMFLLGSKDTSGVKDIIEEIRCSLSNYKIEYAKVCSEGHTILEADIHSDGEYQIEIVIQKV